MIGTLFSIAIAIYLFFNPITDGIQYIGLLGMTLVVVATLFVITQALITVFAWGPIQKAEQNMTSRIMEMFKGDRQIRITNFLLLIFLLATYLIAIDVMFLNLFDKTTLLVIWTVMLGVAIDLVHHFLHRVMDYLNPYQVVDLFGKRATESVQNGDELELFSWIDTMAETAVKALEKKSTSLAEHAMNKIREVTKLYLETEKSIVIHEEEEAEELGVADPISYTLFYIFQRLEMVNERALQHRLEPICSDLISILGKITIYAAKFDMTLASYPIHYMGKFAKAAQERNLQDVANRATLTLFEVGKIMIDEIDLQYTEIKDAYLSIITYMHEIATETFKKDKTMNIKILIQPFEDLKALFKQEKMAGHQDTAAIVQSTDAVLGEFTALQGVMATIPPGEKTEG